MKKYKIAMGVDPAFRTSGFCVCLIDSLTMEVGFVNFKDGFLLFLEACVKDRDVIDLDTVIAIENSNLQNVNFDKKGSKEVVARKGRNVGANQAVSQLSVDACRLYTAAKVMEVSPKNKGSKWNQKQFEAVLKQEGHTLVQKKKGNNQDERDAYKLALIALRELKRLNNCK